LLRATVIGTGSGFINAMAEFCEAAGADVIPLAEALGYDARIGRRFLSPGLGYGGGCLPKDIRAFRATAADLGVSSLVSLLGTVDAINVGRRDRVVALARQAAGGSLDGRRVAVLGVAFKPDSDDVRGHRRALLPGRRSLACGRLDRPRPWPPGR
jgi:UDPglucose 6-dehydrogenase